MTDAAAPQPSVLPRITGRVGRLTLNRPRAINALDLDMIDVLSAALDAWRDDPAVTVVVLDGAGERGLCAGGDIRGLYDQVSGAAPADAAGFFRREYALNAAIAEYPAPVVTLADGITMGGGIGLSGHAQLRVVTERSRLAMPETRIGFTPDVGGSRLLAQAPGRLGEYLALTGSSMDASDAIALGFADHLVPAERLDDLRSALCGDADPAGVVRSFAVAPGESRLAAARSWIDDVFAADTVPEIIARLRALSGTGDASTGSGPVEAADALAGASPMGMAVTLEAVRRARALPGLRAALEQEYGLVMWFVMTQPDLVEGIRAQVVDKDRSPRGKPATSDDVSADAVASAFSFAPPLPLWE